MLCTVAVVVGVGVAVANMHAGKHFEHDNTREWDQDLNTQMLSQRQKGIETV